MRHFPRPKTRDDALAVFTRDLLISTILLLRAILHDAFRAKMRRLQPLYSHCLCQPGGPYFLRAAKGSTLPEYYIKYAVMASP